MLMRCAENAEEKFLMSQRQENQIVENIPFLCLRSRDFLEFMSKGFMFHTFVSVVFFSKTMCCLLIFSQ